MSDMKKIVAVVILMMLVAMLFPGVTLAASEMKRGSRGEGVREAQEWLIELGYLDGEADGIFGKKTEAAAKKFQQTIGVKVTGRLTVTQLDELEFLLMDANAVMEGDGLGEDELQEMYPAGCCRTDDKPGAVDYCWRHFEAGRLNARLRLPALPDKAVKMFAEQAVPQWEQAIRDLYDEWENENPDVAEKQLDIFETEMSEKEAELEGKYGAGSAKALQEMAYWLEDVCVDRCFDLHTAEGNSD